MSSPDTADDWAKLAEQIEKRAAGYAARGGTIYNGSIIAEELRYWRRKVASLSALQRVPDGWRLVPEEPIQSDSLMNEADDEIETLRTQLIIAGEKFAGAMDEINQSQAENERLKAALSALQRGPRWRHVKRGSEYTEIARGVAQVSHHPIEDWSSVVIYRCDKDGTHWVRNAVEFDDGRFEPVIADHREPTKPATLPLLRERKTFDPREVGFTLNQEPEPKEAPPELKGRAFD